MQALRAAEERWLAPTALPLARRMGVIGWEPDGFLAFCGRCGGSVGPHEESEFGCAACRDERLPWERFVRLGEFDGPLRQWVHEVKFTRWQRLGDDLGRLLGRRMLDSGLPAGKAVVVPMPTTWLRRTTRGIDHAGVVAHGVAAAVGGRVERLLAREHRRAQRTLSPAERLRNVSGAFRRAGGPISAGGVVVLVDDVRTSGATLRAAAGALKGRRKAGFALWVGTLGVASDPDRRGLGGW